MKLSDYKFTDKKNKVVIAEELKRENPEVAEVLMFQGIANEFFVTLDEIKRKTARNEDYSEDIAKFNKLLKVIEEYTAVAMPGKTSVAPIISSMNNMINRENLGEALNSMNFFQYTEAIGEIKRNVYGALDIKIDELSDKDNDLYYLIRGALIADCSKPEYEFQSSELKIDINKKGIVVNNNLLSVDYNAAQARRRELLKEFDIDSVLKELGITSPVQRMLAKRKIDPAVLLAIKESDFEGPSLELFKKAVGDSYYIDESKVSELREKTVKKYVASMVGKEVEDDGQNAFYIEYNVREVENPKMKRYAKRAEGIKNTTVIGDTRSSFEVLRDKIFGRKIDDSKVDVIENYDSSRFEDEKVEGVDNSSKIVDSFTLDFDKLKGIPDSTSGKPKGDIDLDEQNGGGEEK